MYLGIETRCEPLKVLEHHGSSPQHFRKRFYSSSLLAHRAHGAVALQVKERQTRLTQSLANCRKTAHVRIAEFHGISDNALRVGRSGLIEDILGNLARPGWIERAGAPWLTEQSAGQAQEYGVGIVSADMTERS